jgi:hypothetical protein
MTDRGTFETSTDVRYVAAFGLAGNFLDILYRFRPVPGEEIRSPESLAASAGCCARAASGHPTPAPPPSSVMKARRLTRSPRRQARAACLEFGGRAPSRS